MPFRSPQPPDNTHAALTAADALDARIMQHRYGAQLRAITRPAFISRRQTSNTLASLARPANGTHYIEHRIPLFEFVHFRDGQRRSLILYQPTPAGVRQLVRHGIGTERRPLDIAISESIQTRGQSVDQRLCEYLRQVDWWEIVPNHPHICILLDGQRHAIPVVLAVDETAARHVIILDSTAGSSEGLYRRAAQQHPGLSFWLNKGSRQVDGQSCITDAIEMAFHAADHDPADGNLLDRIKSREIRPNKRKRPENSRLPFAPNAHPKTDPLHLFHLPEELCICVQNPHFLEADLTDLDRTIRVNGENCSLRQHLQASRDIARRQYFNSDTSAQSAFRLLNCYLYTASERHARVLDALAAEQIQPVRD